MGMKTTKQQLENQVWARLRQVLDPELNINLVDLGLIYQVQVEWRAESKAVQPKLPQPLPRRPHIFIQMTLTTPGCPLAEVFDPMIRESLLGLSLDLDGEQQTNVDRQGRDMLEESGQPWVIDIEKDVEIELTFDPPWAMDMMSEEARAELGVD